jgi:hypothetical protein
MKRLQWIGWILWWASAVFGWLPIFTLRVNFVTGIIRLIARRAAA